MLEAPSIYDSLFPAPILALSLFFFFPLVVLHSMWVLSSQLGIEPVPLALKAQHLNHWTTREAPQFSFFIR